MRCSAEDCEAEAVTALRFKGQLGHVHVCSQDESIDREWCDVAESAPLPCPWTGCDVVIFTGQPTPLGETP